MKRLKFNFFSGSLIILFAGTLSFTLIEKQILNSIQADLPVEPKVAGATVGLGATVEPTLENRAWDEIRNKQLELDAREKLIKQKEVRLSDFFAPTEKTIRALYMILITLGVLICINIYLDLRLWKRRKKLA